MTAPRVIGLDLSLTGSGIASSDGWCEVVGQKDVTTQPLDRRLAIIDDLAAQILNLVCAPDLVVIEQPAFSRAGAGSIERHALWWLVVRSLRGHELPVAEVTARGRMRYATGKGAATKSAVVDAAARRWPSFETGGNDNLADAVVLCAMGRDWLGAPLSTLPQTHRAALAVVTWPDLLAVAA